MAGRLRRRARRPVRYAHVPIFLPPCLSHGNVTAGAPWVGTRAVQTGCVFAQ